MTLAAVVDSTCLIALENVTGRAIGRQILYTVLRWCLEIQDRDYGYRKDIRDSEGNCKPQPTPTRWPSLNGYKLMKQIRAYYPIQGIAMSGYGMEDDLRKSRETGFSDALS